MAKKKSIMTIPSYTYEDTSDPNIKRFCDMKGDWTHYFIVNEKRFVKAVNHVIKLGHPKGPNFMDWLARTTPEEMRKLLDEKGDEGSRTHRAIEQMLDGFKVKMTTKFPTDLQDGRQTVLTADEWDNLLGFVNWCVKYQPRKIDKEFVVWNETYAGTVDAFLIITIPAGDKDFDKAYWGKDVLILPDWKSSGAIWFEYEAQTSAYWHAVKRMKKFAAFIKKFEGSIFTGVVRLGSRHKCKYEFVAWDQKTTEGEHWDRFVAAQLMAKRYESSFEPNVEEIPIELFIKVPKAVVPATKKASIKKK